MNKSPNSPNSAGSPERFLLPGRFGNWPVSLVSLLCGLGFLGGVMTRFFPVVAVVISMIFLASGAIGGPTAGASFVVGIACGFWIIWELYR